MVKGRQVSNEEMKEYLRAKLKPAADELPTIERRKQLREAFNLSQRELARRLNVSSATMSGWESGRNNPTGEGRQRYIAFCRDAEEVLAEQERNADDKAEG